MTPTLAVSAQVTLLLSCALVVAIIIVIAVMYNNRDAHRLVTRLRQLITNPRTPGDTAPDAPQQGDATGPSPPLSSPPPPAEMPAGSPPRMLTAQLTGARYGPDTFALVAEHADHTQRLAIAEARVERVLDTLPSEGWFVQRFALVAGDRIPFLVLGEHGVFALWPMGWRPQWSDPAFVCRIASNLKNRLPAYPGPVNAGLCGTIQPDIQPRFWYRSGTDGGAWILGIDWLIPWMQHFGHQHGLGTDDIKRFRALATPDWTRPVAPVPPGIPIINAGPNIE